MQTGGMPLIKNDMGICNESECGIRVPKNIVWSAE